MELSKVGALRKILPDQAVCVLVGAALTRHVGIAEERFRCQCFAHYFMSGKLRSIIKSDRLDCTCDRRKQPDNGLRGVARTHGLQ